MFTCKFTTSFTNKSNFPFKHVTYITYNYTCLYSVTHNYRSNYAKVLIQIYEWVL